MQNPCLKCLVYPACKNDYFYKANRVALREDALMQLAMKCPLLLKYLVTQYNEAHVIKKIMNPLTGREIVFLYNVKFLESFVLSYHSV